MPSIATKLPPAIWGWGDTARARRTDKLTSHKAADKSAARRPQIKAEVFRIVQKSGPIGGSVINYKYAQLVEKGKAPQAHPDSPRKRAGELVADGLLVEVGSAMSRFGTVETVYGVAR